MPRTALNIIHTPDKRRATMSRAITDLLAIYNTPKILRISRINATTPIILATIAIISIISFFFAIYIFHSVLQRY